MPSYQHGDYYRQCSQADPNCVRAITFFCLRYALVRLAKCFTVKFQRLLTMTLLRVVALRLGPPQPHVS